ncbi:MAG: cell division protein FtsW [Planctomycetia bacterium]|nr:cell division protein FtsW [Planctomycetia bacterium]
MVAVLLGFGVLMVHSASITSRPSEVEQVFLSRHLMFVAVGTIAAMIAACIPANRWQALAPWLFWGVLVLLVLVLVPGVGAKVNGARRWFRHGSLSGQPSELMKIALPLFVCCVAARHRDRLHSWFRGTVVVTFPLLIVVPVVMVEPDLGTALFLAATGATALFVTGWPIRNFLAAGLLAVPAVIAAVLKRPYQMQRISGFLETWADWTQAPYHLKQSLVTLGAGGIWGVGLGKGFQKLSFLPEANTDFVFAVIGEELGLLGALSVIGLWLGVYVLGLRLLRSVERNSFAYNAAFVLLTQLVFQVALNVAVVTAMVPPKGIPHPLISYGGSNLVVSLVTVGIILSLTRRTNPVEARPVVAN